MQQPQRQPWPRRFTTYILRIWTEIQMDASGVMRKITGMANGSAGTQDASTVKQMEDYVTAAIGDNVAKMPVHAGTTAALPANTRTADVLKANTVGAFPTIDNVAPVINQEYLVKNEGGGASHINNGIYELTVLGDGATEWELTRRHDMEGGESASGAMVPISDGTVNGDTTFKCINNIGSDTINTDALEFWFWGQTTDHGNLKNVTTSQHHTKYTDAEARAAINDIFGADGKADADIDIDGHKLLKVLELVFDGAAISHIRGHRDYDTEWNFETGRQLIFKNNISSTIAIIKESGAKVEIGATTLSEVVTTDSNNDLSSEAKNSAFNKAFGTGSGDVCEGDDNRLVGRGVAFPGSPSDGDLFNRTDLDMVFRYDGTRTKWLSEKTMTAIFSRGAGAAGVSVYFLVGNVPMSSTNGFPIIEDMTIVSAGFRNASTLTRNIELQVNGVNQQTLTITAASIFKKTDVDVDVDVDEYISPAMLSGTGALSNGTLVLNLKWRAA